MASERHARTVSDAVRSAGVPVLGVVRRSDTLSLDSRHLGLLAPHEGSASSVYAAAADVAEREIDLDELVAIATDTVPLTYEIPATAELVGRRVRIALARDDAFWFYDESSLEALVDAGAGLVPYSPLRDPFPNVDAALIGGGYPELHAAALSANAAAIDGLHRAIDAGMPVYAECGGLMYLSRALETSDGTHPMVAAVPAISTMSPRRSALRYVEAKTLGAGPMFTPGDVVRGHEFHYSQTRYERGAPAFALEDGDEGYARKNIHASYVHVHLGAHLPAVATFIARARAFGAAA